MVDFGMIICGGIEPFVFARSDGRWTGFDHNRSLILPLRRKYIKGTCSPSLGIHAGGCTGLHKGERGSLGDTQDPLEEDRGRPK